MDVTDTGIPVDEVVTAVKNAIKLAGISSSDSGRDLQVVSFRLILNAVATLTAGGGVDLRVPFLGMKLSFGGSITRRDTHAIHITLMPPDLGQQHEIRDIPVETVLLEAVETIRSVMTRAAGGDDPFLLEDASVELSFAVTKEGSITLGFNGELKDEITHTLRLGLAAAGSLADRLAGRSPAHQMPPRYGRPDPDAVLLWRSK